MDNPAVNTCSSSSIPVNCLRESPIARNTPNCTIRPDKLKNQIEHITDQRDEDRDQEAET